MSYEADIPINDEYEQKKIQTSILIISEYSKGDRKKLNISKISQTLGVSRAWIYKNYGSSTEEILQTSIEIVSPLLTGLRRDATIWDQDETSKWLADIIVSFEIAIDQVKLYPELFKFYLSERLNSSAIGKHLLLQESRYMTEVVQKQLKHVFKFTDNSNCEALAKLLFALKIGLLFQWLPMSHEELDKQKPLLKGLVSEFINFKK